MILSDLGNGMENNLMNRIIFIVGGRKENSDK